MKKIKPSLCLICYFTVFISCNSNSLTQANAEKTIREFLSTHRISTSTFEISSSTIQKIEKTNVYSQFDASVRVSFKSKNEQGFTLLFDFTRTPKNKWFLKSVEEVDGSTQGLSDWLNRNKKLNIAAQ